VLVPSPAASASSTPVREATSIMSVTVASV
jgi:hypothetical protein